jgi:XTP/dITP diphosphohydrolase
MNNGRMKHEIFFVTGNVHKLEEASRILSKFGIHLKMLDYEKVEIQSNTLVRIAKYAASLASMKLKKTLIVEDSGLFINALNGFPGPFSSYVYRTVGCRGVLKLLSGKANRNSVFKCVVAFCSPSTNPLIFEGKAFGSIALSVKGSGGFGFDPIFIPKKGDGRTFAELIPEDKDRLSHRGAAFRNFGEWYIKH